MKIYNRLLLPVAPCMVRLYMSVLKNGVLLHNRKAENRPLIKVICSLLLFAPCLSALMISCCEYFLITAKLSVLRAFLCVMVLFPVLIKKNQCYNHGDQFRYRNGKPYTRYAQKIRQCKQQHCNQSKSPQE